MVRYVTFKTQDDSSEYSALRNVYTTTISSYHIISYHIVPYEINIKRTYWIPYDTLNILNTLNGPGYTEVDGGSGTTHERS